MAKERKATDDNRELEKNATREDDNSESIVCVVCGGTPCDWIVSGDEIISEVELMYNKDPQKGKGNIENRCIRKSAYRYYIYLKHGLLGKGNQIQIPSCVLDRIREKWPESDGNYMGYRSSKVKWQTGIGQG
jgi:hypothetical protein